MDGLVEILIYGGIGIVIAAVFIYIICREERNEHHE